MISYEKYAEIRNSKGLRDADVAKIAKIPPSTFTEWKKGQYTPKFDKMCKIADALGMIYMELIDSEGKNSSENPNLPQDRDQFIDAPRLQRSEFDELFNSATPEIQQAVLTMLKAARHDT